MIARVFASFRVWLILAMLGTAAVGVALTSFAVVRFTTSGEQSGDFAKAEQVARAIARRAEA